ncbi:20567_t:CDS:2 [Entrophospora sp. SA101]|nr:2281_t:CDS:2 [Entrophospora sp. SA101]CAJ0763693.1 20567_t:CDS:2 [Entrophospora sp. SA101]CAJ0902745.1 5256_t:CDS:2 [Entrophospora sp. SA101]CAJ0923028.1 1510_t:CDS:2 [Entrophospora sp. SA101]CAJ0923051.1 1519_t:CDS:2 [Entrophospora sp. SA101]
MSTANENNNQIIKDPQEQIVNPWNVRGAIIEGEPQAINYDKLIEQFGTKSIEKDLLERFETLTGKKCHVFLRRGVFFSHRWLQEVFDVPLVIQLTDDEKFLFRADLTLEDANKYAYENAKDIVACGFKLEKTYIFSNLDSISGPFYRNIVRIAKCITTSQLKSTFGFNDSDNIGKLHFAAIQSAPSFSNTFPQIFGTDSDIPCLIPCAIDQGSQTKMSASVDNSAIFMTDTRDKIQTKINKYAFSGGGDTLELHKLHGGNPDIDVAYQYLRVFLNNDEELDNLYKTYKSGELMTNELKAVCIKVIQEFVGDFQKRKSEISDELVRQFMDSNRKIHI